MKGVVYHGPEDFKVEQVPDPGLLLEGDALLRVTQDSSLREELIEKGYTRAAEFSWQATAAAAVDTYLKCAASKE